MATRVIGGHEARVTIDVVFHPVVETLILRAFRWTASLSGQEYDISVAGATDLTTLEVYGPRLYTSHIIDTTIEMELYYESQDNPFDDRALKGNWQTYLRPHDHWKNLTVYPDKNQPFVFWRWPFGMWKTLEVMGEVRSVTTVRIIGLSESQPIYPRA
jgi:hypothetical protein